MQDNQKEQNFRFAISLSVLNHLGRNLYRNFITVLGEAISNSWDADAKNVWIDIDRENSKFSIMDDGLGMEPEDFQNRFLKIGYSKRTENGLRSGLDRPFIGAKGIGKLAMLSCAKRVSVFSKTEGAEYTGGVIDNTGLDQAITSDLTPEQYPLEALNFELIEGIQDRHQKGTIIVFEETKDQLKNSIAHIKKLLAMSFRFSLIDPNFSIFVNGEKVTIDDLSGLMENTEFLWSINNYHDDFTAGLTALKNPALNLTTTLDVKGFLATVEKPRHLKITGTDDRATIDLFVNGRLREKNILRHIPTQRILESYLYGQLHFDAMDSGDGDPFTSSREGVVEDDANFQALLDYLKREVLPEILDKWDELRLGRGKEGDDENPRKSKKERRATELFSIVKDEYETDADAPGKDEVDQWLNELRADAEYNLTAYVDCFLSENLLRKFIVKHGVELDAGAPAQIKQWKDNEVSYKGKANISFSIRQDDNDPSYLGMDLLALSVEGGKPSGSTQSLWTDALTYKPIRNAVGHTGLLTSTAKTQLSVTRENIKGRIKTLVSGKKTK